MRTFRPIFPRPLRLTLSVALSLLFLAPCTIQSAEKISRFGEYSGYSQQEYQTWHRSSCYITTRDGSKLAADILRPSNDGKPTDKPLPAIWANDRYLRAVRTPEKILSHLDPYDWNVHLWLKSIILHGYVAVIVEPRGTGASFGNQKNGPFSLEERNDLYDVSEWIAGQPWCDGKVGMFGQSYLGMSQYWAASMAPPHLKTIIPAVAGGDSYDLLFDGGIFSDDFAKMWGSSTKSLDSSPAIVSVDEDSSGAMLEQAKQGHLKNADIYALFSGVRYRDSTSAISGEKTWETGIPIAYTNKINASGVSIYHWGGWYDGFTRDTFTWFANCTAPQKLAVGPWFHMQCYPALVEAEFLRWYDYWLKSIPNGIMDEPPIRYYTIGAPENAAWRTAKAWPIPEAKQKRYFFGAGPSGSSASVNNGALGVEAPVVSNGADKYTVDYSVGMAKPSRGSNVYGQGMGNVAPAVMTDIDRKGLTYSTPPLAGDTVITGYPVAHLWVSSSAKDGDFFVYLAEVDHAGKSVYVTEGKLRASNRATAVPPYNNLGMPWHRNFKKDIRPLPREPVELVFALQPTSKLFRQGSRIRITVVCADKGEYETPVLDPPPVVTVYRESAHPSYVVLPVAGK